MRTRFAQPTYILISLFLGALLLLACAPYRLRLDQEQPLSTNASPALSNGHALAQSFVPAHDHLSAVQFMPASLPATNGNPYPGPAITLTLRQDAPSAAIIATGTASLADLHANEFYQFSFPRQANSRGKRYLLEARGPESARIALQQSALDVYGGGQTWIGDEKAPGDWTFRTYYEEDVPMLLRYLADGIRNNGLLAVPLLLLLFLPGFVAYILILPGESPDLPEALAFSFGLSLALIPLAFLWARTLGLRINRSLLLFVAFAVLAIAAVAILRFQQSHHRYWRRAIRPGKPFLLLWGFVLLVTVAVRYLEIRDLVLPLWVDSVFHASVTQLFLQQGGLPTTYRPLMPVDQFVYHFGFHALAATFSWLTGMSVPRVLLGLGQALNALLILPVYLLVRHLSGRRLAGLIAMLIVGLVSLMPAYYVSWGRYTQLAGLALLPVCMVATRQWLQPSDRQLRHLVLAALGVSGLLLTHYRVLVYYACYVVAYLLVRSVTTRRKRIETWKRSAWLALSVVLLTAPWLINLGQHVLLPFISAREGLVSSATYSAFPWEFVRIRHNGSLLALATAGIIWAIIRRNRAMLTVVLWVGLVGLAANPNLVGLRPIWLINNATAVISLFLPIAILGGYVLADLLEIAHRQLSPHWRLLIQPATGLAIVLVGLWGAWSLADVVNPVTVLATADDRAALTWVRQNTPPDALFLINTRFWQNDVYTGSDGGYWLTPLTGRRALLPMSHYIYGSPDYIRRITELAKETATVSSVDDTRFLEMLRAEKVTHVYVGAKGGTLTIGALVASPHFRPLYHHGAAWVFAFRG
ncbi:MAG: hypothetical protein GXP41_08565 [Chloroflexi bacterium]|nr:hypothetical protein [Chloroflexota bacterium]